MRHWFLLLLAAVLMAGCATVRTQPPASAPPSPDAAVSADAPALSAWIQAMGGVSRRARPDSAATQIAEQWSPELAGAISRLGAAPTVENEVGLAQAYVRTGISDKAFEHFARAARLDPAEGAAWDGLARIWRDWGLPHVGLGDAYRAAYATPSSPAVHNTLGTILQFLGRGPEARAQFAHAVALDPGAAYAQNNLCYSWLMDANAEAAGIECGRALAIEPGLVVARNNLALARAVAGDLAGAVEIFGAVGGEAAARYNLGIVYMAQRRYSAAADAFDQAAALQPSLPLARDRARQARQHAAAALDDEGAHERR